MNHYEAMVLLNNAEVKKGSEEAVSRVHALIERHGGELVFSREWTERKLAYPINRQKRATYYLMGFRAPPEAITPINRDCGLYEPILRLMILARSAEQLEQIKEAAPAARPEAAATEEGAAAAPEAAGAGSAEAAPAAEPVESAETPAEPSVEPTAEPKGEQADG